MSPLVGRRGNQNSHDGGTIDNCYWVVWRRRHHSYGGTLELKAGALYGLLVLTSNGLIAC